MPVALPRDCLQFVLDELRKAGQDQHAALLEKFGLDPGKLAEKAAERGLASR